MVQADRDAHGNPPRDPLFFFFFFLVLVSGKKSLKEGPYSTLQVDLQG